MAFQNENESPGALAGLGTSMKQYAKSQWIEMGGIVVLIFITSTIMVGGLLSGDPNDMTGVETGIFVLIGGMLAFEIYVLFRYFQMGYWLKITGQSTNNHQFQKGTKM